MKNKACLARGLVALGITLFADTLTRPAFGQQLPSTDSLELVHSERFLYDDEVIKEEKAPKIMELDVYVKPVNNLRIPIALYDDNQANGSSSENGQGFLEKNLSDFFDI